MHKASIESISRSLRKLQTILLGSLNAVPNLPILFLKFSILHKHNTQKLNLDETNHIFSNGSHCSLNISSFTTYSENAYKRCYLASLKVIVLVLFVVTSHFF